MTRQIRPLFLLLLASACVSAPSARTAPRPATAVATPSGLATAGPWVLRPNTAPQNVLVTLQAVVTITGDPATRVDSLRSTLDASYAQLPGNVRRLDGRLTAFQVASGAGTPTSVAGLTLPARFSVVIGGTGAGFHLPSAANVCTEPSLSVMQGLYDAWTLLPDTLRLRTEWTDTVQTISCRDRVPLKGTSIRHFRVARADVENGRVMVTIERRAKTRLAGEGEQFGEHVTVDGQGESMVRYALDVQSNRWLRASGTSTLDLAFKSKIRDQRVRQENQISLSWTP